MPKKRITSIKPISWKKLIKIFEKAEFEQVRKIGSHIILSKIGVSRPLVVQRNKEVPVFAILTNINSAGLSREEYLELLNSL